jgi:hypothetical protein
LLDKEREFAENSPMPPPEFAAEGVYCTGPECHDLQPNWERDVKELLPPKSSVEPVWIVEGFGRGKSSARENAPIHFGDTPQVPEKAEGEKPAASASPAVKRATKPATKAAMKKKSAAKSAARGKARR